jgi:hypothetical protein
MAYDLNMGVMNRELEKKVARITAPRNITPRWIFQCKKMLIILLFLK